MDGVEGVDPIAETSQAAVTANRLTMNRLTMNRLTMNSLSATKLSPNGQQLSATALAETEEGRELLTYLIRCALPDDASLTATVNGTTYEFPGLIGLTPGWMQGPLTASGRRWLSACLLAHVNGYGVQVAISIRGNHPALAADTGERSAYGVQEISFFGDVIGPSSDDVDEEGVDPEVIPMYACGSQALKTTCGSDPATYYPARTCSSADDCEIEFLGACRDSSGAHVCGSALAEGYSKCHTAAKNAFGFWPEGQVYNEVITVYMSPTDINAFYTGCSPLPTQ